MKPDKVNTRILIIDDEESIRDSFREILNPKKSDFSSLDKAGSALFGSQPPKGNDAPKENGLFDFELDEAHNGKYALELVKKAIAEDRPYSTIFCDMRMPGWDGLNTVQHIREIDLRSEIIFVTAFSDHTIDDIVSRAGANVSYFCKPFAPEEIRQLATKSVFEWNKSRGLERLIHVIANLKAENHQLEQLLHNILLQVSELVNANSSMIAIKSENGDLKKIAAIGKLTQDSISDDYIQTIPKDDSTVTTSSYAYFPVNKYGIFALFDNNANSLNSERYYMVKLFLEQAGQAIENTTLQEELIQKQKLSAVGQAIGMISHDLRGPLGGISSAVSIAKDFLEDNHTANVGDMLTCISEYCELTNNLVEDVLDYSQGKNGATSEVSIEHIMVIVNQLLGDFLKTKNVVFETDIQSELTVIGEERKLARIIYNLSKNAIEALDRLDDQSKKVAVRIHEDQSLVRFEISDNGPGIPPELKENLFKPFATKGKTGGTGLGLAIVKNFVEAHQSAINVDSSSKGTCFSFALQSSSTPQPAAVKPI